MSLHFIKPYDCIRLTAGVTNFLCAKLRSQFFCACVWGGVERWGHHFEKEFLSLKDIIGKRIKHQSCSSLHEWQKNMDVYTHLNIFVDSHRLDGSLQRMF